MGRISGPRCGAAIRVAVKGLPFQLLFGVCWRLVPRGGAMPGQKFLLYRQRPAAEQVRAALGSATLFPVIFLAVFPFRNIGLPKFDGYVPAIESLMMLGDLITAALLFSQASAT